MSGEIEKPTREQLMQQLIDKTKHLIQKGEEPFKMIPYDVNPDEFRPSDDILKSRFFGPVRRIRLLLSKMDGNFLIQTHIQLPSETKVINFIVSTTKTPELSEYQAFDPKSSLPYTTPIPIRAEITKETVQNFINLLDLAKPGE